MSTKHPLVEEQRFCHDGCYETRCPRCRWSAGEEHYRADADAENGELSRWGETRLEAGMECPHCAQMAAPVPTEMPDWERELVAQMWRELVVVDGRELHGGEATSRG